VINRDNRFPDSLGLLYSAVTHHLGWKHRFDEEIVTGLASYGDPDAPVPGQDRTYHDVFSEMVRETGEYSYHIDHSWSAYHEERNRWISDKFIEVLGPGRQPDDTIEERHKHLAAAMQRRLEDIVLGQLLRARKEFGFDRLALAGSVALNCSLNGKIAEAGIFDEIFVQPASGDSGISVGACYLLHRDLHEAIQPRRRDNFFLGSTFTDAEIEAAFAATGVTPQRSTDVFAIAAERLEQGLVVG